MPLPRQTTNAREKGSPTPAELPPEVRAEVAPLLAPDEQVRLAVATDMRPDGVYGAAYLVATDRQLLSISPDGGCPKGRVWTCPGSPPSRSRSCSAATP